MARDQISHPYKSTGFLRGHKNMKDSELHRKKQLLSEQGTKSVHFKAKILFVIE
jgi:hypothetical protein